MWKGKEEIPKPLEKIKKLYQKVLTIKYDYDIIIV